MALAEARAAWQRAANRCLVQEDAKRAPKLAYCSSVSPSAKENDTEATGTVGSQEIRSTVSIPYWNPSYSNLSPNSRWWLQLQLQQNYGYQKGLMDGHFNSTEPVMESCQTCDTSGIPSKKEDNFEPVYHCMHVEDSCNNQCRAFTAYEKEDFMDKDEEFAAVDSKNWQDPLVIEVKEVARELTDEGLVGCKAFKNSYSDSSWIGTEKTTLQWQTAGTEELALLIAQRSKDLMHNCDLPTPQNNCVNKRISTSSLHSKSNILSRPFLISHNYTVGSCTAGSACQKLRMSAESRITSSAGKPLRDGPAYKGIYENGGSNAQLLEALLLSQTRAREADKAAKQASADKEHVLKLVLRQASLLFAYKQWIQLLQLENMYFRFKSSKSLPLSDVFPVMLPWTSQRPRKMRKNMQKFSCRKRAKYFCLPQFCVGKYVLFALGLGLIGAGLLLGWTIGQLLPA